MADNKISFQNIATSVLAAAVIGVGGWGLKSHTDLALLDQRMETETKAREKADAQLRAEMAENEANTIKMQETMSSLDRTLGILIDRLERGDITVRSHKSS